ncbi:hypothetical protein [Elizabethkingia anophelis]|uniref:hypothetical protein n=1 Tax=Elizabethkingia anophelis TaxID=1117645 RepID=UPI00378706A0
MRLTKDDLNAFINEPDTISLIGKAESGGHVIDVDVKDNFIVDKSRSTHSYEAAFITSFIRKHLLEKGSSYSFESVMSHPSKLTEISAAKSLGYKTYLYFVCLEDPEINISLVQNRVKQGGYSVPSEKIISRYDSTLNNLLPALMLVDKAYLFDNSTSEMDLFAEVEKGQINILSEKIPYWFVEYVTNKLDI